MMRPQNLSISHQHGRHPGFHFRHDRRMGFALLFCSIALLSSQSFSQPLAQGKSKFLGCSIRSIRPDFTTYWNQVTAENAGKWVSVEGSQGSYNWAPLDDIYNYAVNSYLPYRHHNLIWGQQQPAWITSLDSASQRAEVEEWIHLVGDRYPSSSFIDVVNEPFNAPPPYMNALGGTGATGWDWVIQAFQWARQYCLLGVKLTLNEYNILQSNSVTDNFLRLIDTLRVRNLIDAIGIQGHYFEFKGSGYSYPISTLKYNLERLTATGLPVYITEFDINEADDSAQLANYQTYFPLFWEEPGVRGITLWGYVQGDIWKTNAYLIRYNGSERPALQWLRRYLASPLKPVLVSPVGTTGEPRNPILMWKPSVSALSYHIQLATDRGFSSVLVDTSVGDTLLQLSPLAANTTFYWHVSAVNDSGASAYSVTADFATGDQIVAMDDLGGIPTEFKLCQNYPNPFNPSTTIEFTVPTRSNVHLVLVNILGQVVKEIVHENYEAGNFRVTLDATNLASGVYFYKMVTERFVKAKKLVLMK